MSIKKSVSNYLKNKFVKTVAEPLDAMVDENLTDITTTIGSFVIRSVRGKFQRSISFTIGVSYVDYWMEDALYAILYRYNDIRNSSKLRISNTRGSKADGSSMYCKLDDGIHNLKYRDYNILLAIQSKSPQSASGRINPVVEYTVITYDLSPEFVTLFEKDMVAHRNSLLRIRKDSPVVNVFCDAHEGDGYTYWDKMASINKRRIGTIYLPYETKKQIVTAINEFFASKDYYVKHGVAHNLKILLYGPPGPQPVTEVIPTPDGMKKIGDIKPGDTVFATNGKPTVVEEIYEYKDLYEYAVEFADGRVVKCGGDHKFPVIVDDRFQETSIYRMLEEGLFDDTGRPRFTIPTGAGVEFPCQKVESDPWVIGLSVTSPPEKESISYKIIPDEYIFNSSDVRYALLRGALAYGGSSTPIMCPDEKHVERYEVKYTCTNKKVIEQIAFIVRSLGLFCMVSDIIINPDINDVYNGYNGYVGTITIFCSHKDMKMLYKGQAIGTFKHTNYKRTRSISIVKITNTRCIKDMRCLHVADRMHLYQSTDFVLTCNSGKDSIAKMIASEWNRNLYYVSGGKDGRFIPNAITSNDEAVNYPLFLISDIDKYPYLINEPDVNITDGDGGKEEAIRQKQLFGNMINALDGILSGEDRIIVMTTNHIEKFSETFLRPGRVDLKILIDYITPEIFRKFTYDMYNVVLPSDIKLKDNQLTISTLQRDVMFLKLTSDEFIKKYVK